MAEAQDWRVSLISYLRDPGRGAERNIRRLAFKYVVIDDELRKPKTGRAIRVPIRVDFGLRSV